MCTKSKELASESDMVAKRGQSSPLAPKVCVLDIPGPQGVCFGHRFARAICSACHLARLLLLWLSRVGLALCSCANLSASSSARLLA